jgi:hypothetical protein
MKIVCHRRRPALFHPALPPKRSGAVLVAAVIALLTAAVILFGVLKAAVNHYRQIRTNRYAVQAHALANAGIDRALAQLRQSDKYQGEVWKLASEDLDNTAPGEVKIQIETATNDPDRLHVKVQADYPSDTEQRARKSRETIIHLK